MTIERLLQIVMNGDPHTEAEAFDAFYELLQYRIGTSLTKVDPNLIADLRSYGSRMENDALNITKLCDRLNRTLSENE